MTKKIISGCSIAVTVFCLIFSFAAKTYAAKTESAPAVTYTAPITLYWLSKAGVPEAVEYVKYINAEKILKPENISLNELKKSTKFIMKLGIVP